jgi:hypothetical protein
VKAKSARLDIGAVMVQVIAVNGSQIGVYVQEEKSQLE